MSAEYIIYDQTTGTKITVSEEQLQTGLAMFTEMEKMAEKPSDALEVKQVIIVIGPPERRLDNGISKKAR